MDAKKAQRNAKVHHYLSLLTFLLVAVRLPLIMRGRRTA